MNNIEAQWAQSLFQLCQAYSMYSFLTVFTLLHAAELYMYTLYSSSILQDSSTRSRIMHERDHVIMHEREFVDMLTTAAAAQVPGMSFSTENPRNLQIPPYTVKMFWWCVDNWYQMLPHCSMLLCLGQIGGRCNTERARDSMHGDEAYIYLLKSSSV